MMPKLISVLMLAAAFLNGSFLCAEKGLYEMTEPPRDQGLVPLPRLTPPTLDYGTIQVGTTSLPQTMTLTNITK